MKFKPSYCYSQTSHWRHLDSDTIEEEKLNSCWFEFELDNLSWCNTLDLSEVQTTIDLLNPSPVVFRQLKVLSFHPLVKWSHDSHRIVGVFQTQSMTQLVNSDQKQVITWVSKTGHIQVRRMGRPHTWSTILLSWWNVINYKFNKLGFVFVLFNLGTVEFTLTFKVNLKMFRIFTIFFFPP